jgi:hypothetical protein
MCARKSVRRLEISRSPSAAKARAGLPVPESSKRLKVVLLTWDGLDKKLFIPFVNYRKSRYRKTFRKRLFQKVQMRELQKKYLRQHSVLDWSPTSILSGPCDACLRGSDETRKVHRGMAADEIASPSWQLVGPLVQRRARSLLYLIASNLTSDELDR